MSVKKARLNAYAEQTGRRCLMYGNLIPLEKKEGLKNTLKALKLALSGVCFV
jgi:hypothetical protein